MAKTREKQKAQEMRHRGESIRDIAKTLNVSKSTVSYWCRNITLTDAQQKRLTQKRHTKGAAKLLEQAEKKRAWHRYHTQLYADKGVQDVDILSKRERFFLGLALYWSRGYRKGAEEVGFVNGDPAIICFIVDWFQEQYDVKKDEFILRVNINELHKDRIEEIERYWSDITGISHKQFTKPSLVRAAAGKKYADHDTHMGTLRVKVRRSTNLKRRIVGSLSEIGNTYIRTSGNQA